MVSISDRLREERERLGYSQAQLAELAGQSRKSQMRYESGERSPDGDYFGSIARHGVDVLYVLTGERSELPRQMDYIQRNFGPALDLANRVKRQVNAAIDAIPDTDFVPIPVHEAELAAGGGSDNGTDSIIDYLAFRKDWLRRVDVQIRSAALVRARGESMMPTISDGDMLLVDTTVLDAPFKTRATGDKRPAIIYALRDEYGARVKRIERVSEGRIMLLSDNPIFPPEILADNDVTIIGKVVWWGHTNRD